MKIKIIKTLSCFLIMFMCLFAFQYKAFAQSSNATFEPFEVGMTFPIGYELTYDNSNGIVPSQKYIFIGYADGNLTYEFEIYLDELGFYYNVDGDNFGEELSTVILGYFYDEPIAGLDDLELTNIISYGNNGELGIYSDNVEEPNAIYSGTYELLANLIYGTTENLTSTQIGTIEFISMIITILCVMLPFIILFFILRKLVD